MFNEDEEELAVDGPGEVKERLDDVEAEESVRSRVASKIGDSACEEAVFVENDIDVLRGAI